MRQIPVTTSTFADVAADLLRREFADPAGRIFARFDEQDSGNVSFGVEAHGARYFVKTAGASHAIGLPLAHADRLALLGNAERLARSVSHRALTRFVRSCECAWGRALVYEWADGEHLHAKRERRDDPTTAWQRFLHLPQGERLAVVQALLDLHVELAAKGWVVGDCYDGCQRRDPLQHEIGKAAPPKTGHRRHHSHTPASTELAAANAMESHAPARPPKACARRCGQRLAQLQGRQGVAFAVGAEVCAKQCPPRIWIGERLARVPILWVRLSSPCASPRPQVARKCAAQIVWSSLGDDIRKLFEADSIVPRLHKH